MVPSRRVLILGCGSVAQATLPLLLDQLPTDPRTVTVMAPENGREHIRTSLQRGVRYEQASVTRENLPEILGAHVGSGDLLIDLAWNIDTATIVSWCHDHGVLYLNTSVEVWDPYEGGAARHPVDRTLYARHLRLREMKSAWDRPGPTAVVEHGANPGLVSHFTKQALTEIAAEVIREDPAAELATSLEEAREEGAYNTLAQLLGVRTIHISERDTQITSIPKRVDEFVNTWSVEGFYEEGIATAEMGWGTHERTLPAGAFTHAEGPGNQICLARPGMKTWVRSWVPSGEITGMVVRHGEAFTISDQLTVWNGRGAAYRPTVHYAYCPADVAIASLHELEMRRFRLQPDQRILRDHEIVSGHDELGVLLLGHRLNGWWTGTVLTIDESRRLLPGHNATTLQVAASILGAVRWMLAHPDRGVLVPDDLPWADVLETARPWLGDIVSCRTDWNPSTSRVNLFDGWDGDRPDPDDAWQFASFRA
ncbi:MAG: saccharopine dehydrogenase NADP-binding domain-containing protein [Acidimicrobiales bacterium]